MVSPEGLDAVVWAAKRDLRHRVAQHAGSDRAALGMVSAAAATVSNCGATNSAAHEAGRR